MMFRTIGLIAGAATIVLACCPAMTRNPLFADQFVADPSAHAFGKEVYLYATNDSGNDGKYWNSSDWRAFSSSDMRHWTDHGSIASVKVFGWASGLAWAPDAIHHRGQYYMLLPVDRTRIGVARGPTPIGPFVDNIGAPLIDKARDINVGAEPIDPTVFADDDGALYLMFGSRVPKMVRLSDDLKSMAGPIRDVTIEGSPPGAPYGEAPWLHKRGGLYYLSYSTGWPGQIVYATSARVTGPYRFRGVILDRMNSVTNHQAIVDFGGRSYLFYHNKGLPGASDYKRSINVDRLYYRADGSIRQVVPTGGGAAPGMAAVPNPAK